MSVPAGSDITTLLAELRQGNQGVISQLVNLVYPQLRRLARQYMKRERSSHTLQPTALVHEVYLRLFGSRPVGWQDRAHFFAIAAQQMRLILVDHARSRNTAKRGGGQTRISLDDMDALPGAGLDLADLDAALTDLARLDPRAARLVELRFFGGLTERESSEVLGVSVSTLKHDWQFARAWLFNRLHGS
jgi:RNA polymerase sigma factor (TIGR02999 family)